MPRSYGGKTADQRRAERRAALIAAGRELLGTEGWAATSLRAVCARAGLSDRYFYESFADRDALLAAVFKETTDEAVAAVVAALADAPDGDPRALARSAVGAIVGFLDAQPGGARVALFDTPDSPVLHQLRRESIRRFVALISATAATVGTGPGGARTDRTDRTLTAYGLIGALSELLIAQLEGELDGVPLDRLLDHAAALAAATTGMSSAPAPAGPTPPR